jgi:SAM-dependent methyltransferase
MVSDTFRTEAFARAISQVVKPGDVVLDVGTGTGILAMLAARAGARKVYAVDQSEIARLATDLVRANGLEDIVRVFRGPSSALDIGEKVDVLVSEWLGHFAFVEAMLDDVLTARDAHLAPGGRMIPGSVDVCLAPIDDPVLYVYDGPGFWRESVMGFDFSILEGAELSASRALQRRVAARSLLSPGQAIVSLNLETARHEDQWGRGHREYPVDRDGMLNGFVGWFDAQLSPDERLGTGPHKPETHWRQSYLPFPPMRVEKGSRLSVDFSLERDGLERRNVRLILTVNGVRQSYTLE